MEEWRFLVVQIAGIGDLILATPALDALRERFPKCTLDVVTSPPAVSILQGHKSVDSVCSFDINRFRNFPTSLTLRNLIQLVQEIKPFRAKNYNALISLNKIASKRGSLTLGLFFLGLNIPACSQISIFVLSDLPSSTTFLPKDSAISTIFISRVIDEAKAAIIILPIPCLITFSKPS